MIRRLLDTDPWWIVLAIAFGITAAFVMAIPA